jgi:phosphatidylethanolamine N-methyltransferase
VFFLCYFLFWRAAYDAGLGWVLTKQSKKRWIVREVQRRGWLDGERRPLVRKWIREQLVGKMGKDYSFDVCEFLHSTTETDFCRIGFTGRVQLVAFVPSSRGYHSDQVRTLILIVGVSYSRSLSDFLSYCMFAFTCFRVPNGLSMFAHVMRYPP